MSIEQSKFKKRLHRAIFDTDTTWGKRFDISLLVLIVISIVIVMLESVDSLDQKYGTIFKVLEWTLTILFTIEYALRLYLVQKPLKYAFSFYGIVDLISILPTYLGLFFVGTHYFLSVRSLRLLRIFRIFKLGRFLKESEILVSALRASRIKITVFLGVVLAAALIAGSLLYMVEATANPQFGSIPTSVYWAIVTITTVGYGDISPITPFGKFLSALLMILGYGVIAVPTGIVSVELAQAEKNAKDKLNTRNCINCSAEGHDNDAQFCKYCGDQL